VSKYFISLLFTGNNFVHVRIKQQVSIFCKTLLLDKIDSYINYNFKVKK